MMLIFALPMKNFSDDILSFLQQLEFRGNLPADISVMNPYRRNDEILEVIRAFYTKYYSDNKNRRLILGINPGRLGAGVTGIPFTDTKRLKENCGIEISGFQTHEPSSVFIYNLIDAYGGPVSFYENYYISSVSPLGFISNKDGKVVNYNYYDNKVLKEAIIPFAEETIRAQIAFGIKTDVCFCLGTGDNYKFIDALNERNGLFGQVIPLEHPRYIMQYKSKDMDKYIARYLDAFNDVDS